MGIKKNKVLLMANGTNCTYKFRKELLAALVKKGWEVVLSCPDDGFLSELQELGVCYIETKVDRRGMNPLKDFRLFLQYIVLLKHEKPDVLLGYTIKPNIYGNMAAKLFRIPIISTITGLGDTFLSSGFFPVFVRFLYRISLSRNTFVAFQNKRDQSVFLEAGLIPMSRSFLLYGSGVNLEEFVPCVYPPQKKIIFTYIGRILKSKGINELLSASQRLKGVYGNLVEIWLAGYFDENYREIVLDYHEKEIVVYLGFQKEVRSIVEKSSCIVLPSYQEGMSNALLEAAATAKPLIATNIFGCKEIVHDGVNGFLCEPRSAEQLYAVMEKFVLLPDDQKIQMAETSRLIVEQKFDRTVVVNTMLDKISNLLSL